MPCPACVGLLVGGDSVRCGAPSTRHSHVWQERISAPSIRYALTCSGGFRAPSTRYSPARNGRDVLGIQRQKHGSGNEGTTCMHQKIEKTGNSEMSTAVRTTVTPDRRRQRQIRRKIGPRLAVFEPAGTPITASAMWSGHENDPPRFRGSSSDPEGQIVAGAGFEPATSGL